MKALSLRQPWADAVLFGGKRIENRVAWRSSNFRGPLLIHAAKGCTRPEYDGVLRFLDERAIAWRPAPFEKIVRGGIVGIARVVHVVAHERHFDALAHTYEGLDDQRRWYMGAFALILADVEPLEFVPWKGALGFFNVPDEALTAIGVTP